MKAPTQSTSGPRRLPSCSARCVTPERNPVPPRGLHSDVDTWAGGKWLPAQVATSTIRRRQGDLISIYAKVAKNMNVKTTVDLEKAIRYAEYRRLLATTDSAADRWLSAIQRLLRLQRLRRALFCDA